MGKSIKNLVYYLGFGLGLSFCGLFAWLKHREAETAVEDSIKFNRLLEGDKSITKASFGTVTYRQLVDCLALIEFLRGESSNQQLNDEQIKRIWMEAEIISTSKAVLNLVSVLNSGKERDLGYLSRRQSLWELIKDYAEYCSLNSTFKKSHLEYKYSRAAFIGANSQSVKENVDYQSICSHVLDRKTCSYK